MRNICGRSYSGCRVSSKMVTERAVPVIKTGLRLGLGLVLYRREPFIFYFFLNILTSSSTIRGSFPRSRRRSLGRTSTVADPVVARAQIRCARPGCPCWTRAECACSAGVARRARTVPRTTSVASTRPTAMPCAANWSRRLTRRTRRTRVFYFM